MNDLGKLLIAASMIVSPWFISACGNKSDGDDDDGRSSGRSGICDSICARAAECGAGSRNNCLDACRNDTVSSSAALQIVEICAADVSCSGFSTGDLSECVSQGITDLDTTAATEEYCDAWRDWAGECLGTAPSTAECYAVANAASSAYLAELTDCLSEDCEEAPDCVEAVDTRYDAGDSILQLVYDGFGGSDSCCSTGDPCDWANDGVCDCGGTYGWDANDCASEPLTCAWTNDGECDEPDLCPVGTDTADCSGVVDCCSAGDPCDWANDSICDCSGAYAWDADDCAADGGDSCVWAFDGVCDEPEFCDYGTDTTDCSSGVDCCTAANLCDYAGDGYCDCGGAFAWDDADCGGSTPGNTCTYAYDGICDEPTFCDYGTDTSDCAGSCCSASDPCDWANDSICDCNGAFAWDANDCSVSGGDSCIWAFDGICDEPEYCDYGTDTTDCSGF